jgi:AcrR family transcriptional regulator
MSEARTDRRVRRTRDLLRRALQELIIEQGYDRITVQEILDRADVGRSTFYAHYRDKDDLLESGFEDVRMAIEAERDAVEHGRPKTALLDPLLAVFRHAEGHRRFWEALSRKGGADVLIRMVRQSVDDLIREHFRDQFPITDRGKRLEPAIRFVAGACIEMLLWWVESEEVLSAEQIHADFKRLATHGVRRFVTS